LIEYIPILLALYADVNSTLFLPVSARKYFSVASDSVYPFLGHWGIQITLGAPCICPLLFPLVDILTKSSCDTPINLG